MGALRACHLGHLAVEGAHALDEQLVPADDPFRYAEIGEFDVAALVDHAVDDALAVHVVDRAEQLHVDEPHLSLAEPLDGRVLPP